MALRKITRAQIRSVAIKLAKDQGGVCLLCGKPLDFTIKGVTGDSVVVDHCHITGRIRGALHRSCNGGEGKVVGCKAFLRGVPKVAVPSIEVETGSEIELEIPFSISRYQLFVDGKEIILVDKLAGICRINGTDYAEQVNSLL